ncbi:MAG: hypothetical protein K6G45_00910 [Lachnospiraceae bacterium]|nr:hypothetical protein [Lachnospiraceae bacterium]
MKADKLIDALGEIRDDFIEDAEINDAEINVTGEKIWIRYVVAAACLCVIAMSWILISHGMRRSTHSVQQWSNSMTAADYFGNSRNSKDKGSSASADLVMMPYAVSLSINSQREALEDSGILPFISDHTDQDFRVAFNGDGSLYKVSFMWMRRGENIQEYSDLIFTAAPAELHEISDVVYFRTDADGNTIPPYITTTVRDGITIYAEGTENENKTVTWQTDQGWYRISGSFKDSYEAVIALLDWFWIHPLNLAAFEHFANEVFVFSDRTEYPDAFRDQIPDFALLGYSAETERVNLGMAENSMTPVWFDGVYTRGDIRIRWTINTGADAVAWSKCIGRPSEITEKKLSDALSGMDQVNVFFDMVVNDTPYRMPAMATLTVERGTADDAWEILQTFGN